MILRTKILRIKIHKTMKITSLIFIFLFFNVFNIFTQEPIFVDKNAVWYYSYSHIGTDGYLKQEFELDTIINDTACMKFTSYIEQYDHETENYFNSYIEPLYLFEADSTVFLFDRFTNHFDTLYNFNALPDDIWRNILNYWDEYTDCSTSNVLVLDTGTTTISGQNLRWLYLEYQFDNEDINNYSDTVYSQIGTLFNHFHPYFSCQSVVETAVNFRCFQNNNFSFIRDGYQYECDHILNISTDYQTEQSLIVIYPNPAKDQITIDVSKKSSSKTHVQIYDMQGRTVFSEFFNEQIININTSNYHSGMYMLDIRQANDVFKSKIYVE